MAGKRVVLHIGTMKSGTTYLQSVLGSNAEALGRAGIQVVPGRFAEDQGRPHRAARELHGSRGKRREWTRLVEFIDRSPGEIVVVSTEFFSFLGPAGVEAAVSDLAGHDLTVVLGVRDQVGAIPAQWQTYTRNRGGAPFASYLHQIASGDPQRYAARSFRLAQDVPAIVDRWNRPGVDRLALLLLPPSGSPPDLTWTRFAAIAGLSAVDVDLGDVAENRSLGYAACDSLRRLNRQLSQMPTPTYRQVVRPLARDVLAAAPDRSRPQLDRVGAAFALERNKAIRAVLEQGVEHVGDLSDIAVDLDPASFPEEVPPPDRAEVHRCARLVLEHAAERAGEPVPAARRTPDLIAEAARLLWPGHAD